MENIKDQDEMQVYESIQPHVQKEIQDALARYSTKNQFDLSKIPSHEHGGSDAPKINPKNLLGFPIMVEAPTDNAIEGTIRLALISGVYYLYARVNNLWKRVTLT